MPGRLTDADARAVLSAALENVDQAGQEMLKSREAALAELDEQASGGWPARARRAVRAGAGAGDARVSSRSSRRIRVDSGGRARRFCPVLVGPLSLRHVHTLKHGGRELR
jgi:hypothetical protein